MVRIHHRNKSKLTLVDVGYTSRVIRPAARADVVSRLRMMTVFQGTISVICDQR